jgi:hypothetical protein
MAGTWVFSRGEHRIEIRRRDREDGADLIVTGEQGTDVHPFPQVEQLLDFETELERRLTLLGWHLADFFPDRRTGRQRRRAPREPERRRLQSARPSDHQR